MMPIWLRWAITVVIVLTLLNSTIKFAVRRREPRQRLAFVLSALLIVLLAIYYYSWLAALFPIHSRVRLWIATHAQRAVRDSWIHIGPHPNPLFSATFVAIAIVGASYIVRAGVYRFTNDEEHRGIHDLTSSYTVNLTCAVTLVVTAGTVYGVSGVDQGILILVALLLLLTPSLRFIVTIAAQIARMITRIIAITARTLWKYLVLVAVSIAQFVMSLDDSLRRAIDRFVRQPIQRFEERTARYLKTREERVDSKLKLRENIQRRKDRRFRYRSDGSDRPDMSGGGIEEA
jgi:hypothetical protein